MRNFAFALTLAMAVVAGQSASAQTANQPTTAQYVDAYLNNVNKLPREIVRLLNVYQTTEVYQETCLNLKALYLTGEAFKSDSDFSRQAAS